MIVATYRTMDPSLEEAGRIHGLNMTKTLRYITLPLTFPGILAAAIYIFTMGLSAFEVPAIIGMSNKIFTFSTFIFYKMQPLEELPNYGVAGAVSSLLVVLALVLSWWYFRVLRFSSRYAVVTGRAYRPKLVELGARGRLYAWIFLGLFFLVAKLLPFFLLAWAALLSYFQPPSWAALSQVSLRNFYGLPWDLLWAGARNTLLLMLAVPSLTLVLCLAISWVILRSDLKWRIVFDALAFLPHAVPSIILAIAAVFVALFLLRGILPLYGTLSLLVLVYTISRISFATRIINNSLAQIHPELEEAAFAGGLRVLQVMRKILLPLLKPALVYAWLWMALLCYRELTMASVLVTNQNNVTLPMIVWGLWLGELESGCSGQSGDPRFHVACGLAVFDGGPKEPLRGGAVISVSGVRKNFKSGEQIVAALNGIDLQVGKKEFFVLLGPSGSGKTTLMRCIAGLEKPDAGSIILDDKTVFSASPRRNVPPEARQIGMVFQSYAIWPHMTVAENIGLVLTHGPARLSQNEAGERIRHALHLVQLDDFERRPGC